MWNHTTDGAPEDFAWSALVERTSRWLDIATFTQEGQVLQLRAMEVSGNVDFLTADDNDFLAQEQLLRDD